jgi:hypothetical protein
MLDIVGGSADEGERVGERGRWNECVEEVGVSGGERGSGMERMQGSRGDGGLMDASSEEIGMAQMEV